MPQERALNNDVLYLVIEELSTLSPGTLPSLARVSKDLYALTIKLIYRTIDVSQQRKAKQFRPLLSLTRNLSLGSYAERIVLGSHTTDDVVTTLMELLPQMCHVKDFQ
jgi:hypothetical protein